jgi:hypothetical protein
MFKLSSTKPLLFILIGFFFTSCDKKGFNPLNEVDKYIEDYYDHSLGQSVVKKEGVPSVYVDFSDGIIQAYTSNPENKTTIDVLTQKLAGQIDWYGMGKSFNGIGKLSFKDDRDLYNQVVTPTNYTDIMAPIEEAIQKIVANHNDAILITDFEEYTPNGKEQTFAYAKKYFIEWLQKGNSITFFYNKFHEKNNKTKIDTDKNLYFAVFNYGKKSKDGLSQKFVDALNGRGVNYKTFDLNTNPFTITNDYGGVDKTGLANRLVGYAKTNKNGFLLKPEKPFEFIGIKKTWDKSFDKDNIQKIIKESSGVFLNKLFLNADQTKQSCYILNKIKLNTVDVTEDFKEFAMFKEASEKHKPILTKDEGKNDVWDSESRKDTFIKNYYVVNTKVLKKEKLYKYNENSPKLDEVFDYDAKIFSDHLKNTPNKIELKTLLHKNYVVEKISKNNSKSLLRIDYVIDEPTANITNSQLNDFSWKSGINQSTINNSLYESIRNTIQEFKPNDVLYSYFIKLNNPK